MSNLPSTRDNLPSAQDAVGPLGGLPAEIQLRLLNAHFMGAKDKNPISVRPDEAMLKAMTAILADIRARGGIPWLQTQSDLLRAGFELFILAYGISHDDLPEELLSIIITMKANGEAWTTNRMEKAVEETISLRSADCARMINDPAAQMKLKNMLVGLVNDVLRLDEYWQSRHVVAMLEDRAIYGALKKFGLLDRLEKE